MATFQGNVTQNGWAFKFETTPEESGAHTSAFTLGFHFIQAQVELQAEGQKFIRETLKTETPETFTNANGQTHTNTEEAETIES